MLTRGRSRFGDSGLLSGQGECVGRGRANGMGRLGDANNVGDDMDAWRSEPKPIVGSLLFAASFILLIGGEAGVGVLDP